MAYERENLPPPSDDLLPATPRDAAAAAAGLLVLPMILGGSYGLLDAYSVSASARAFGSYLVGSLTQVVLLVLMTFILIVASRRLLTRRTRVGSLLPALVLLGLLSAWYYWDFFNRYRVAGERFSYHVIPLMIEHLATPLAVALILWADRRTHTRQLPPWLRLARQLFAIGLAALAVREIIGFVFVYFVDAGPSEFPPRTLVLPGLRLLGILAGWLLLILALLAPPPSPRSLIRTVVTAAGLVLGIRMLEFLGPILARTAPTPDVRLVLYSLLDVARNAGVIGAAFFLIRIPTAPPLVSVAEQQLHSASQPL